MAHCWWRCVQSSKRFESLHAISISQSFWRRDILKIRGEYRIIVIWHKPCLHFSFREYIFVPVQIGYEVSYVRQSYFNVIWHVMNEQQRNENWIIMTLPIVWRWKWNLAISFFFACVTAKIYFRNIIIRKFSINISYRFNGFMNHAKNRSKINAAQNVIYFVITNRVKWESRSQISIMWFHFGWHWRCGPFPSCDQCLCIHST